MMFGRLGSAGSGVLQAAAITAKLIADCHVSRERKRCLGCLSCLRRIGPHDTARAGISAAEEGRPELP